MIRVELSESELPIEPGGAAQLAVSLTNAQDHDDHVALEIEGLDVEWYAIPVPAVTIPAGESHTARILFKVKRNQESRAGAYPFVVRAKGMEMGASGIQQATLVVRPFTSLQLSIEPRRATSTFLRPESPFYVTIANLGNQAQTLNLSAADPEDDCTYQFEQDRCELKPGDSVTVPLVVEPAIRSVLGSSRLTGFTVTARSTEDSYLTASASGQIERRALLSTGAAIVLLILVLLGSAYSIFRPRPVDLRSFAATPMQVVAGDQVRLSWDVLNASDGGYITPGHLKIKSGVDSLLVQPTETTTYTLVARGGGAEHSKSVTVVVTPRPAAAKGKITEFAASSRIIHQGDSVLLRWKVSGVRLMVLNPLGKELNPSLFTSYDDKPQQTTTYVLSAIGMDGAAVSSSVTVEVVPPDVCIAQIKGFRAKPEAITAGETATLAWMVENAATIEIDNGVKSNLERQGSVTVTPTETTTYTLRVTDNKGNLRSRSVTVKVSPPEPPSLQEPLTPP